MAPPSDQIVSAAAELGLELIGWDDTHGGVRGDGIEFVGTHSEIRAYLYGWVANQEQSIVRRGMLVFRTQSRGSGVIVDPGKSVSIGVKPTVRGFDFKVDRIAIPDSIAAYVEIEEIRVSDKTQDIMGYRPIPGDVFAAHIDSVARFELTGDISRFEPSHGFFEADTNISDFNQRISKIEMTKPAFADFGRAVTLDTATADAAITVRVRLVDSAPGPMPIVVIMLGANVRQVNPKARALLGAWSHIVGGSMQSPGDP